jgi:thiamine biosynthesis lipoprotein
MASLTLARLAMATRFEIVLHGENPVDLRAAGEEALDEIDRLENHLSLYRPSSEIAHVNACAAKQPVRVTPGLFALLEHARKLHQETGGAFDITIAPLVQCWGFMGGSGHLPQPGELEQARANVGMHLVELNSKDFTIRFAREGVMIDLGAIGKGYAVGRAAEVLREAGVSSALVHGGTSTVYAIGAPPEAAAWNIAIPKPQLGNPPIQQSTHPLPDCLAVVPLKDEALSVSAGSGKFFRAEGKVFGHVLDPRTGQPADAALMAAVVLPSATETDAFSTALLTRGAEGHQAFASLRPNMRTVLVIPSGDSFRVETTGPGAEPWIAKASGRN